MIQRKFLAACGANRIDQARELLRTERHRIRIDDPGNDQKTPLHLAIVNSSVDLVRLLVENGSDVDLGSVSVIRNESAPNDFFRFDEPPVVTAARMNDLVIAEYLIRCGSAVNKRSILLDDRRSARETSRDSKPGTTALHHASFHQNVPLIMRLIDRGANPQEVDHNGNLPMHLAAVCKKGARTCRQQVEVLGLLCRLGSDPSLRNRRCCSALMLSVMYGCLPSVEVLLGAWNIRDKMDSFAASGQSSPLHVSALKDRLDILVALVKAGHKLDSTDHKQLTPLQVNANGHSSSPVSLILIYHGCDVDCFGRSPSFPSLMTIVLKNPRFDCESLAYALVKVGYDLNQDTWLVPDEGIRTDEGCISRISFFPRKRLENFPQVPSFDVPRGRLQKLKGWLQGELREPKKLSDVCRIVVRRTLYVAANGASIEDRVGRLSLPKKLECFVLLRDFIQQSDDGVMTVLF